MILAKGDNCKYETRFELGNGDIVLWINHGSRTDCFVSLQYSDKQNSKAMDREALKDL